MSTYVQRKVSVVKQIGGLTNVTATAPLVSSGGLTPDISITPGSAPGDLLVWDGAAWVVATPVARLLASGVATLSGIGEAIVSEALADSASRFVLTAQPGTPFGVLATGAMQVYTVQVGVGFTIRSAAGAADSGVDVYWQLWSA